MPEIQAVQPVAARVIGRSRVDLTGNHPRFIDRPTIDADSSSDLKFLFIGGVGDMAGRNYLPIAQHFLPNAQFDCLDPRAEKIKPELSYTNRFTSPGQVSFEDYNGIGVYTPSSVRAEIMNAILASDFAGNIDAEKPLGFFGDRVNVLELYNNCRVLPSDSTLSSPALLYALHGDGINQSPIERIGAIKQIRASYVEPKDTDGLTAELQVRDSFIGPANGGGLSDMGFHVLNGIGAVLHSRRIDLSQSEVIDSGFGNMLGGPLGTADSYGWAILKAPNSEDNGNQEINIAFDAGFAPKGSHNKTRIIEVHGENGSVQIDLGSKTKVVLALNSSEDYEERVFPSSGAFNEAKLPHSYRYGTLVTGSLDWMTENNKELALPHNLHQTIARITFETLFKLYDIAQDGDLTDALGINIRPSSIVNHKAQIEGLESLNLETIT